MSNSASLGGYASILTILVDSIIFYLIIIIFFFWRDDLHCFLHISSSWVKMRWHTENQLPGLPGSGLKDWVGGVGGPTNYFVTPNLS